jgi:hypothetical protein
MLTWNLPTKQSELKAGAGGLIKMVEAAQPTLTLQTARSRTRLNLQTVKLHGTLSLLQLINA